MIDLSYLTEEEQEMIMTVLKRDADLKKSEEDRVKHLQKLGPVESRLKYMTGEWFYEAKSQRHQDRIHGSDIIFASMKQKKPMTVEFLTQSWRERGSKGSNDVTTPKLESSDRLKQRSEPPDTQRDVQNMDIRSPSRPRHNPFNTIPIDLDLEEINSQTINEAGKLPVKAEKPSAGKMSKETVVKTEVSGKLQEKAPRQKPVPKKRTKLYRLQSPVSDSSVSTQSVSTTSSIAASTSTNYSTQSPVSTQSVSTSSDIRSTVSTQSRSTNSSLRSPPPRGVLRYNSSCSSSESNVKSKLLQPSLNRISSNSSLDQDPENHKTAEVKAEEISVSLKDQESLQASSPLKPTLPKSRLPVRSPLPLNSPIESVQERPRIQPRLSLTSSTWSDDNPKTTSLDLSNNKQENVDRNKKIPETVKNEPLSIPRIIARSPLEALLDKQSYVPQSTPQKLQEKDNKMSKKDVKEAQDQKDSLHKFVDQHVYGISDAADESQKADASSKYEIKYSPTRFNIDGKTGNANIKPDNYNRALVVDSHTPKPGEEQGDSIAKVLEWFSRSSDSSDKLDSESSVQDMEDDIKMEDIDFEDAINPRRKPEDNVYLIIPRQNKENASKVTTVFSKDSEWEEEVSVDEPECLTKTQNVREQVWKSKPLKEEHISAIGSPKSDAFYQESIAHRKTDSSENASLVTATKKENSNFSKLDSTESKPVQNQERGGVDPEDSDSPKIANLKSFWERGNAGPRILVSRSNVTAEKGNKAPTQNNIGRKAIDYAEEPLKVEPSSKVTYAEPDTKHQASVKDVSKVEKSSDVFQEHLNKDATATKAKNVQTSWTYSSQKKDRSNSTTDPDISSGLHLKSSSSLLDSGSLVGGQSNENVRVPQSINSSDGDCISPVVLESALGTKLEEKDTETKTRPPPRSSVHTQQPAARQNSQQHDNRAERIKQLKSFWEKEKWEPRIYVKPTVAEDTKSSLNSPMKLNKRFTKSEFDLRYIGTELDDELEGSARDGTSTNFTVLPLRDRMEKSAEGMNSLQFKTLRDFWAGSSNKQLPAYDSKIQRTSNCKGFEDESLNDKSPKPERGFQPPLKDRTTRPDFEAKSNISCKPSVESDLKLVHSSQPRRGSQTSLKDPSSPKPPGIHNKEPRQVRRSSKGALEGRGNSLRRATSMFAVNVDDEDPNQNSHLQSKKAFNTNLPPLRKTADGNVSSRKTPEANFQAKRSPDITKNREKMAERRPSRTSEDSDSQPLARSFVPRDYQHYLGIKENHRGMYTPPHVTEQMSELVCTPFQTSPETGRSQRCPPVRASTPLGSAELRARRGSMGSRVNADPNEDLILETFATTDSWSFSRASSNRDEESAVHGALKRAAGRPIYHKSLEDITAIPRQTRKSSQVDDTVTNSYDMSSTPSPPSSAFSDPEHLRKLSKSVPSFLEKENDGGESDSTSEYSSHSRMHWRNGRHRNNLSSNSGATSMSSVSGSVMSVYSGDFVSVEVQGSIRFSLNYVQKLREFHIFVVQCHNLAVADAKRNRSDPYVKSYLIPDPGNLGKKKTSVKKRTLNPTFTEILRYRVRIDYLKTQILNLSVWHNDTFGRNSFLGEIELDLATWDFGNTQINSVFLKPRASNSIRPSDDRGEMRLALRFLPQISHSKAVPSSGEVHIWVKECKNLPLYRGSSIDSYVKCSVLPDTSKKSRQKTRVLKRTASPVFNHTMVYDGFRAQDLKEACVELTVWDRDRLANHLLGGIRLGLGTGKSYEVKVDWMDSTPEEVTLWERMMELPNEWVEDVLPLRMMTAGK